MRMYRAGAVLAGVACATALAAVVGSLPLMASQDKAAPATIVVLVPANAAITFDGQPTKETGAERLYYTTPLAW